jgi:hypothetical protein
MTAARQLRIPKGHKRRGESRKSGRLRQANWQPAEGTSPRESEWQKAASRGGKATKGIGLFRLKAKILPDLSTKTFAVIPAFAAPAWLG